MSDLETKNLSRSQLVGMLAALRGIVYDLTIGFERRQVDKAPTLADSRDLLRLTAVATSDEDLVDGGFDMTWRWPKDAPPLTKISNAEGGEQPATEHPSGHTGETSSAASAKLEPDAPPSAAETSSADDDDGVMSPEQAEAHLVGYRRHYGMTDEEVVAAAEARTLHLDAERCAWLILLGRGDLIPSASRSAAVSAAEASTNADLRAIERIMAEGLTVEAGPLSDAPYTWSVGHHYYEGPTLADALAAYDAGGVACRPRRDPLATYRNALDTIYTELVELEESLRPEFSETPLTEKRKHQALLLHRAIEHTKYRKQPEFDDRFTPGASQREEGEKPP